MRLQMYLTKSEANKVYQEAIIFDNKIGNIKLLNQKERKLIINAINISILEENQPENQRVIWSDETRELLNNILDKAKDEPKSKHSNLFVSFFKGFANLFLGRISSQKVHNKIKLLTPPQFQENGLYKPKN